MTARRPERPKLSANRESIVPTPPPAASAEADATGAPVPTSTLSLRVPTEIAERVQREIRRLHFETGQPKGTIAAELLEEALARIGEVSARLSAR